MSALYTATLAVAAVALLGGCQSTQEKSAAVEEEGGKSFEARGLTVKKVSKDVKVLSSTVLADENGVAAVGVLKNTSKAPLVKVPVAIDVRGKGKKSLFKNDDPGIEPSLASVSLFQPGETIYWTNDQVFATGEPRSVKVRPGQVPKDAPRDLPKIEVKPAKLVQDPVSGVAAEGKVVNKSDLVQKKLVVFGVARKGNKIVAAGRSQIEKLNPGKSAVYQIFFIGNPKGATIELAAPPTTLE